MGLLCLMAVEAAAVLGAVGSVLLLVEGAVIRISSEWGGGVGGGGGGSAGGCGGAAGGSAGSCGGGDGSGGGRGAGGDSGGYYAAGEATTMMRG